MGCYNVVILEALFKVSHLLISQPFRIEVVY